MQSSLYWGFSQTSQYDVYVYTLKYLVQVAKNKARLKRKEIFTINTKNVYKVLKYNYTLIMTNNNDDDNNLVVMKTFLPALILS